MSEVILNKVREFCKNAVEDADSALEDENITDNSEGIYQGRLELAEYLLEQIDEWEKQFDKEIEARTELERDIDPPEPQEPVKIKSWWISVKWEDGRVEDIDPPTDSMVREMEQYLDELEYDYNRDILEDQAYKYGDPDSDY